MKIDKHHFNFILFLFGGNFVIWNYLNYIFIISLVLTIFILLLFYTNNKFENIFLKFHLAFIKKVSMIINLILMILIYFLFITPVSWIRSIYRLTTKEKDTSWKSADTNINMDKQF